MNLTSVSRVQGALLRWAIAVPFVAAGVGVGLATEPILEIEPGPKEASAEEKAIVADPAAGIEHGVILIEETHRDDTLPGGYRLRYHLRAKILSNEARSLGDITVPFSEEAGRLWKFWAFVIKPDGTVREVERGDLERQVLAENRRASVTVLKKALPEVVPGCIIDYGYDISYHKYDLPEPVSLQRNWPVRLIRYLWVPYRGWPGAYFLSPKARPHAEVEVGKTRLLVTARDIPPAIDEPRMPPRTEVSHQLMLYYRSAGTTGSAFWKEMSTTTEQTLKKFCGSKRRIDKLLRKMGVVATAPAAERLRAAYEWALENISNYALMTKDERQQRNIELEDSMMRRNEVVDSAYDLLDKGWGTRYQISLFLTGIARHLGAEAYLIRLPDRTRKYFRQQIYTLDQFRSYVVEVIWPDSGGQSLFLDIADGMPYGEVAWWLTGVPGFKSTPEGPMIRGVPAAAPERNVIRTTTTVRFIDENEGIEVVSERTGSGQALLLSRRRLRNLPANERKKALLEECHDSADFEVFKAETGDMSELRGDYFLHCEGELLSSGIDDDTTSYNFSWNGSWLFPAPDLEPVERTLPVVFSYNRTVGDEISVWAPEGFRTTPPPAPTRLSSKFGSYLLAITAEEDHYIVKRGFAMGALTILPEDYSELTDFLADVHRSDATPLLFKRKEAP